MPSASTKAEIPASSEPTDPFKRVLLVVEKKVRNLEKRKQKLETYQEKRATGAELEKDQQVAVERYGEVVSSLEFARDLQKQFFSINVDAEKLLKKQAKRGKSEKQMAEMRRVREVLQLQGLLDSLGCEATRSDFQTGKHGAIVLTEDNLTQLDALYKKISPTRDEETNYLEALSEASEHIVSLLDAKDKPVVGTTYKELKELLDLISNCGYFERVSRVSEGPAGSEPSGTETGEGEFEVVQHTDVPAADSQEVQSSLPPAVETVGNGAGEEEGLSHPVQTSSSSSTHEADTTLSQGLTTEQQADALFNTPVTSTAIEQQPAGLSAAAFTQQQQQQQQQQRPFQEIVSSVQGSFNFLQESTIEMESKREFSPHMDPAVVAAHPMPQSQQALVRPPSTHTPESSSLAQPGFGASSFTPDQPSAYGEQQSLNTGLSTMSTVPPGASSVVDQSVNSQVTPQNPPTQDFNSSTFSQTRLPHTLQTDNLFSGSVPAGDPGLLGKPGASDSATISHKQYEIPPQLPMPPGHDQASSQDSQAMSDADKKGMNPNATEFQSLLYNQQGEEDSSKPANDNFQGGVYTNTNYSHQRDQRGGRGGYRNNRGGSGSNRDSRGGNMSNGYSRGGNRGNYQGYAPRNDYRADGYQGYSGGGNSYNNSSGGFHNKRGGEGGRGGNAPRGGSRGGPRGGGYSARGGTGGPRGAPRGVNPQGFGRPNFNQQS